MQYRDKSSDRIVKLTDSPTAFLAVAEPGDAESVATLAGQRVFSLNASTNEDGVYVLEAVSDAESPVEIAKAVEALRASPGVHAVMPAQVDEAGETRYVLPGRIAVQFADTPARDVRKLVRELGGSVRRQFGSSGLYEVDVPEGTGIDAFIETLNAEPQVAFAEPLYYGVNDANLKVSIAVGGDGGDAESVTAALGWNLERIEVAGAWAVTRGRDPIVVAVVDGMPETGHEAIAAKLAAPPADTFVFTADRSVSSHATNIAGIVAGESASFIGAAPGIRVLPLIVNLNSQVYAERAAALRFAATCAVKKAIGRTRIERLVLSCSWKVSGDLAVIRTALDEAVAAGVVVVCSAGNAGTTAVHFPSAYSDGPGALADGVIAVAATDRDDHLASYSNHSPTVDVCAPGGDGLPIDARDVPCTEQGNTYGFAAGTSISAPHVAAVAALMLSANPELAPRDVKRLLGESADPIDALNPAYAGTLGSGRVNARRAVAAAGGPPAAETPAGPRRPRPGRPRRATARSPPAAAAAARG